MHNNNIYKYEILCWRTLTITPIQYVAHKIRLYTNVKSGFRTLFITVKKSQMTKLILSLVTNGIPVINSDFTSMKYRFRLYKHKN